MILPYAEDKKAEDKLLIGIVFIGNLRYCPYLEKYTRVIQSLGREYEVIFWDRDGSEDTREGFYAYTHGKEAGQSRAKKLSGFFGFAKYAKDMIANRRYDKLILLTTLSGIFLDSVLKRYKGRYIFDIRDYSYEHMPFFSGIEKRLIKSSCFTAISSAGFTNFLPEHPYVITHNISAFDIKAAKSFSPCSKGDAVNIAFNGMIRHEEHLKRFIDVFCREPFNLFFHGDGPAKDPLSDYCRDKGYDRAMFTGRYSYEDKPQLLSNAHVINNHYENTVRNRYALSNKLYDALLYRIPLLTEHGTYIGEYTLDHGIGVAANLSSAPDELLKYLEARDENAFNESCGCALEAVYKEEELFENRVAEFVEGGL